MNDKGRSLAGLRPFSLLMRFVPLAGRTAGPSTVALEIEEREEVVECGAVYRRVGIAGGCDGIGEVIAAAARDGRQSPVPLNELEDGDVVCILMADVAALYVG